MKPFFKSGLVAALCHLYDTQAKPQYQTHSGIILEQTAGEITSFSSLGASIISSSRRLSSSDRILAEDDDEDQDDEQEEEEEDYLWLQNYALKFQGCQHIKQWNPDVDEEDDVRIKTKRLVRFRLCPLTTCSSRSSMGCAKGYGDYVVDMAIYVSAYREAISKQEEYKCQIYLYQRCNCQNNGDDDYYDNCVNECFRNGKKYECIEDEGYYDNNEQEKERREINKYFEDGCREFEYNNENRGRYLEDEVDTFYIGSYCADQGGKIYLGMFTDDTCTIFADKNAGRSTYRMLTNRDLPYSTNTMVGGECVNCLEQERVNGEQDRNDENDDKKEIRITDGCLTPYQMAGKCETNMKDKYGGPSSKNENGCYYIEGIKLVRRNGIIDTSFTRPDKIVSFFIFLFAVSFVLLGAFIYYLRMKLGMKINLD